MAAPRIHLLARLSVAYLRYPNSVQSAQIVCNTISWSRMRMASSTVRICLGFKSESSSKGEHAAKLSISTRTSGYQLSALSRATPLNIYI